MCPYISKHYLIIKLTLKQCFSVHFHQSQECSLYYACLEIAMKFCLKSNEFYGLCPRLTGKQEIENILLTNSQENKKINIQMVYLTNKVIWFRSEAVFQVCMQSEIQDLRNWFIESYILL